MSATDAPFGMFEHVERHVGRFFFFALAALEPRRALIAHHAAHIAGR